MKSLLSFGACLALAAVGMTMAGTIAFSGGIAPATKGSDRDALARTRKSVRMLDNIYKQTIVLITDKYVNTVNDFPAGSAAVVLFEKISAAGSHTVRLIDATGQPHDDKNTARDDFEREGIKRLKAGDDYYEQVVQSGGKGQLRAITAVPVVMKKCVMCHPHYADVKAGQPIGAISYRMPIE